MKNKFLVLTTGFALFSMFFGSGNLVFPLIVGKESQGHFLLASLGICLTGVLVPFLGIIAMMLFHGDKNRFFAVMGQKATFWFPLIVLSLMGPFGVLARCITVAHGSFHVLFPESSLLLFSLGACGIIYIMTLNKQQIVSRLGSLLTPFLLLSLAAIALLGFFYGKPPESDPNASWASFQTGFLQGYQTMDLMAAFFFSSFVISHLVEKTAPETDRSTFLKIFYKAIFLGAGLLSAVYMSLVFLGASYGSTLENVAPQEMFGVVAKQVMGVYSAPIVCIAVILACFTTAVVLAALYADFLQKEVSKNLIGSNLAMVITLIIAFAVSTLEFSGIARFLAPILEALYPALIVLTLTNICTELWGAKKRRWPVLFTLAAKLYWF